MKSNHLLFVVLGFLLLTATLGAQDVKFPALDKSPMDAAHYPASSAYKNYLADDAPDRGQKIKVLYCRPMKNGREVFGGLEPWGQDWRLGANEATEITFFQAVEIGGTFIPAGTYTMFAQIYPTQWIVKISKERFIGGAANRDVKQDIAAIVVPTHTVPDVRESFTIGFQKVDEGNVNMIFEWDRTQVAVPINLNPANLAGDDASPMDLVQYPEMSRLRNYVKPEDLDKEVAKVRVVYSRPQMKGRKIFGELLKFGDVWRVGANETTEITFFQDVNIGGTDIKAGRYGIFATVNKDNWEFIIHKNVQSWGNANHNDADNIAKVMAKTEKTPQTLEALSMQFAEKGANQVELIVGWENTMARLPITIK